MSQEQIESIPLTQIGVKRQVRQRFDEESLQGLAASLEAGSLQQPIRVRQIGDEYVIVDGERRTRAAKLAGWTTIPAIIETKELSPGEVLYKQLVSNVQREDLTPLEKARGIKQLIDLTGQPAGQVAKQLGLSQATVSRSLKLLTLPEEVQQQIAAGVIPDSVGYELSQLMDAGEQVLMAEQIASGTMTRDQLQAKRKTKQTDNASGLPSPSRAVARLGAGRSVSVTGNNLTLDAFIAQLEEVLRQARKVRPKGVELKTFLQLLADGAKGTQA